MISNRGKCSARKKTTQVVRIWNQVQSTLSRGIITETLQYRKRPFGPSCLHRPQSQPGRIPVTPHIYPANPPDTKVNLAWPINLTRTSLDCGRKPEHPDETHADTRRMCKLHTDSDPSRESNPGPWSCEAAVLTTVLPCRYI